MGIKVEHGKDVMTPDGLSAMPPAHTLAKWRIFAKPLLCHNLMRSIALLLAVLASFLYLCEGSRGVLSYGGGRPRDHTFAVDFLIKVISLQQYSLELKHQNRTQKSYESILGQQKEFFHMAAISVGSGMHKIYSEGLIALIGDKNAEIRMLALELTIQSLGHRSVFNFCLAANLFEALHAQMQSCLASDPNDMELSFFLEALLIIFEDGAVGASPMLSFIDTLVKVLSSTSMTRSIGFTLRLLAALSKSKEADPAFLSLVADGEAFLSLKGYLNGSEHKVLAAKILNRIAPLSENVEAMDKDTLAQVESIINDDRLEELTGCFAIPTLLSDVLKYLGVY